ncbi:hypothetical protein BDV95DRAFT_29287 [Massariosphaeria phaeospora]|uniref:F-box domain-containing protein n=1 Tax=Massariosphaeria phaeospora TaxID=100035 RepID=A0A7C8MCC9_9PLEO|nr:hypothetical protein BDV95DRAFT_29287 [Massariosphaeria phaeospora]
MARITDLANELLSMIVANLDQPSLVSFALVTRRCRVVAQDVLFQNIRILKDRENNHQSVLFVSFIATLLRRPDLAEKVKTLTLHQPGCTYFDDVDDVPPDALSNASKFVAVVEHIEEYEVQENLAEVLYDGDEHYWYYNLPHGTIAVWTTILLGQVKNLEKLDLICCTQLSLRFGRGGNFPLPALFGYDEWGIHNESIPDIEEFPGLQSLQQLRIHGNDFELGTWYTLPNLRKLELDCQEGFQGTQIDTQKHHEPDLDVLHTLLVRCSMCLLQPSTERGPRNWNAPANPLETLQYFTLPKHLELEFVNGAESVDWIVADEHPKIKEVPILHGYNEGSLNTFFAEWQALERPLRGIESLTIRFAKPFTGEWNNVMPADSLAFLSTLEHLTVPREALTHPNDEMNSPVLSAFLPPQLESLCVYKPDTHIFTWIRELLDVRDAFPKFSKLELQFDDEGDGWPATCAEMHEHCRVEDYSWKRFREAGIEVKCCCHGRSFVQPAVPAW